MHVFRIKSLKFHEFNQPESRAVKVDHHPLGRVEDKRMSKFHTIQGPAQLRTEVGCTSVGGVNVEPQLFFCTCAHHHTDCIKFCCACQMEKEAFWIGLESTERRTDWSQLSQVVKGTHSCRAQRHTQLRSKRNTQTQTGWKMLAENFENFHRNLVPSLFSFNLRTVCV